MSIIKSELFSTVSHLVGFIAALVGTIFLIVLSRDSLQTLITVIIYGFSICFLFASSTLYHGSKTEKNGNPFLRKLDYIAIFFLIAGTYTPLMYTYLTGSWSWGILIAQWSIVLIGTIFKIFMIPIPKWIDASIYLLMGWMVIFPLKQLLSVVPTNSLILIVAGGLAFTLGTVFFVLDKPKPIPGLFEFHEIFHVFVLFGGLFFYITILFAI